MTEVQRDTFIVSLLDTLLCECPYECGSDHTRAEMYRIDQTCGNRIVQCTMGCGHSFKAKAKEMHKKICPRELIKCSLCNLQIFREDMRAHLEDNNNNDID